MKKIFTCLFLISAFVLSSCSKDDDNSISNAEILGSWSESSIVSGGGIVPDTYMKITWTFNSDNTGNERLLTKSGTILNKDVTTPFTYHYKGSTIIITNTDGSTFSNNISVTGNRMKLGTDKSGYFNLTKE
jgi:hypothetical protein